MKLKYLGHASFLITASDGTRIITDPYESGYRNGMISYGPIKEKADVVFITHEHGDHNYLGDIQGSPQVLRGPGVHQAKGIEFKGIATFHDNVQGAERGRNTIFCFTIDGIRVCHMGDLGHWLSQPQITEMGNVDVVLTPMGGRSQIDAPTATELTTRMRARVIIPMHFKTPQIGFELAPVEAFTKGKNNVQTVEGSEVEYTKETLPVTPQVLVLQPAL